MNAPDGIRTRFFRRLLGETQFTPPYPQFMARLELIALLLAALLVAVVLK